MTDFNERIEVEVTENKTEILIRIWLDNGPFEESWAAQYNREIWQSESWKNDATGVSFID